MLRQLVRLRVLDHERQVIKAPDGPALELRIGGQVQDELVRYPQGDDGALTATVLLEAERLQTQDVSVEAQRGSEVLYPEVGVVRADYLQATSPVRLTTESRELTALIFVGRFRGALAED
jgi:hypothetical protein